MHSEAGKGSDRRPTDEKAFADNYDSIFGAKKPSKGSFVQCPTTGKLIPKDEFYSAVDVNAPFVMADIQPYKNMVDGQMITSRSTHREFLKANRLVEVGTETKAHLTRQAPKVDREQLRRDIHTSMQKLGY
jgi:hypothetical protein